MGGGQDTSEVSLPCPALLSLPEKESTTEWVPQANNMLEYSLVCSSCLSIQVKWTAAAYFAHNNMKQLGNHLKNLGLFLNVDLGSAYIFFIPCHLY